MEICLLLCWQAPFHLKRLKCGPGAGEGGGHGARRCTALGLHYLETMSWVGIMPRDGPSTYSYLSEMTDFTFRNAEPKQNVAEYWDEIPVLSYYM